MLAPGSGALISGESERADGEPMGAGNRTANRYYSGPPSDHFDGTLLFNPDGTPPGRFADFLKWQLSRGWSKWPAARPSQFAQAKTEPPIEGSGSRPRMVGHPVT